MSEKVVFCWSGGKDSALALYKLLQNERYEVVSLLTTCSEEFRRVSMHGVRIELAQKQAKAAGLPLDVIFLSGRSSNDEYQTKMTQYLLARKDEGVAAAAFGDIFLEDLKQWREANLSEIGLRGLFPLWKRDTRELIDEFIALGFRSVVCCVSDAYFDASAVGRVIDRDFVDELPENVDPCGENGEFHSFAFDGPVFSARIAYRVGEKVHRRIEAAPSPSGFWFCDLQ